MYVLFAQLMDSVLHCSWFNIKSLINQVWDHIMVFSLKELTKALRQGLLSV